MLKKYNNSKIIEVGLDEAGRGPLFGRVYAAAVNWGDAPENSLIYDSKALKPKQRAEALKWIQNNVEEWAVAWADPEEIDKINILEATKLAMDRAIEKLSFKPDIMIVDGIGWEKKFKTKVISIVKGDQKYYSIAAASIIAKEFHDEYINRVCNQYPILDEKYGLKKNMGYGTKVHMDGLKKHGYSSFHRKTFKYQK